MPAPKAPFDDEDNPPSLGDRTLDRWMGLDELDAPGIALPSALSAPAGNDWDAVRHRQSTVWSRMLHRWRTQATRPGFWSLEPGADLANHWTEYAAGILGWSAIAAVVVALLYLIWYGLTFFQVL